MSEQGLREVHAHDMADLRAKHRRLLESLRQTLSDAKDAVEIDKPAFAVRFLQFALSDIDKEQTRTRYFYYDLVNRVRANHRYAVGDVLNTKDGRKLTVLACEWYQFSWHPKEPVYVYEATGSRIFDDSVW